MGRKSHSPAALPLGKRPSSHSTGAGLAPTGNWPQTVQPTVSRYSDYASLTHNYYKGRNTIYILTCRLFYYNAVSTSNHKVSHSSIITGNVEKQWRIENKMMHICRHMERLDNTVNELDGTGRNQNQCGYGGKRTMDNALQESKLSYNQQAITDLFITLLQYSSHHVNSKTCSQSSCFKVTH